MGNEALQLKWGTVKGWANLSEQSQAILRRFYADGQPLSAMADRPDNLRKEILCELIDQIDGDIWNDWDGVMMTKDKAKAYVRDYIHPRAALLKASDGGA